MPLTAEQIVTYHDDVVELVERVGFRKSKPPIAIVEYNSEWPQRFSDIKERIQNALGDLIVDIVHTGSTSVPGLLAKDTIDVDLTVRDVTDEASYVKPLEEAGFLFLLRQPQWHQHRLFVEDWPEAYPVNLHIWGPETAEVIRHSIFRDWLIKMPTERELYAKVKREAAQATVGGSVMEYNNRKEKILLEILDRAFRDLGYIK